MILRFVEVQLTTDVGLYSGELTGTDAKQLLKGRKHATEASLAQ